MRGTIIPTIKPTTTHSLVLTIAAVHAKTNTVVLIPTRVSRTSIIAERDVMHIRTEITQFQNRIVREIDCFVVEHVLPDIVVLKAIPILIRIIAPITFSRIS